MLALTLSFALFWAGHTVVNYVPMVGDDAAGGSWYVSNVFMCVVYVVAIVFSKKLQLRLASTRFVCVVVALQIASILLRSGFPVASSDGDPLFVPLFFAQHALMALGTAGYAMVLFDRFCCLEGSSDRRFAMLFGTLMSFFFCLAATSLDASIGRVLALAFPALSALVLLRYVPACDPVEGEPCIETRSRRPAPGYLKTLAMIFVFALSLNFIRIAVESSTGTAEAGRAGGFAEIALVLAVITVMEFAFKKPASVAVPLALITLITFAMLCVLMRVRPLFGVASAFAAAGYFYYVTLLWRIAADHARGSSNRVGVMAVAFAVNACGLFFGTVAAHVTLALPETSSLVVSLCIAYLVFVAGFVLSRLDYLGVRRGEEGTPRWRGAYEGEGFERALRSIADEYGLTNRELETLRHAVSRKGYKAIASSMGVSENTVKTHAAHIYQKLDLHSKDELALFVEKRMKEHGANLREP
ncbi:helix-turn-helix transcriptional regulator [Arabiibacter massiliensis]|uniref:helix-turn-helix transcriptional regulator n=1 Tax=Arabiibacter massiliensis TaxID=1870985 RepID=UPI00117A519B|nr:LuxR family transcriptional regulator [Arabiibacter massiliensis]